jgi:prepilin-type N-terminal cleavage/methylation domain-containing protein
VQRCAAGNRPATGFTLIELAVVLVVIALLLGGLLIALATQVDMARVRETETQLAQIEEALLGFAAANGRLPCPATTTSGGEEAPLNPTTNCAADYGAQAFHGFVPANTLGLSGPRNTEGLLVDAWDNPIRYSVTRSNVNGGSVPDFVVANEMRAVGMGILFPDLNICSVWPGVAAADVCMDLASTVVGDFSGSTPPRRGVPAVFFSLGPNARAYYAQTPLPWDEVENAGEFNLPSEWTPDGVYLLPKDRVFVDRTRAGDFDDLVRWVSPNVLYARMMAAGLLP